MGLRTAVSLVSLVFSAAWLGAAPAPASGRTRARKAAPVSLVWHAESAEGETLTAHRPDEPINPASVVKIATSMWALERLGPDFRFETRFFAHGTIDPESGVIAGNLVVQGSGDPDVQYDNAFLIALALNQQGVRRVTGALLVNRTFWIGSENGSEGTVTDPDRRALRMASRLRQAFDSRRWTPSVRADWREFSSRRGLDPRRPPRVAVEGGIGLDGEGRHGELLLVHRSEPLRLLLRRFNCYSNNDVERLGAVLGPPEELEGLVAVRLGVEPEEVRLATTSGLGVNRLTPRHVVALLKEFLVTCERVGVGAEEILPVAGCDGGTLTRFFPGLAMGATAGTVLGKTGTLTTTDRGVSVVAGIAATAAGDVLFCVAAPGSGGRITSARRAEERWLMGLIAAQGGPSIGRCIGEVPSSDAAASLIVVVRPAGVASGGGSAVGVAAR